MVERRSRHAILSAAMAVMIAGLMVGEAAAQNTITQSQLPANGNYTVVTTDGAGNRVIQTKDTSILTTKTYAWNFNTNGNLGSTDGLANAPSTQQNYNTGSSNLQLENPSKITDGGHINGVDDQTAANIALNQDAGCAVELCMAGQNQSSMAAACNFVLDWLNTLQKAGKQAPSCNGSSYTYTPPKCTAPWTLVTLSDSSYACQALLPPDSIAPGVSQSIVNACHAIGAASIYAYPNADGSWTVTGTSDQDTISGPGGSAAFWYQFDVIVYPNGSTNYSPPWTQIWSCYGDGGCTYIYHASGCDDLANRASSVSGCAVGGFSGCDFGSAGGGASGN